MEKHTTLISIPTDELVALMQTNHLEPTPENIVRVVAEFTERFDWHNGADDLLDAIDAVKGE